jgi:PPM family protein phosphatase
VRYIWASGSHQGMIRSNNEDSLFPEASGESEGPKTLMVADGMGGAVGGEVASRLAVNAAASVELSPADRVAAGNRAIREEVAREPALEGMGTTMTLVTVTPEGEAHFAHVGDSRAYLLRGSRLVQVTEDHTVAADLLARGQLTQEEATNHPQKHMLTRVVGLTRFLNVDEETIALQPGDRILLCSDGLVDMVSEPDILEALTGRTPEESTWELIDMANAAGGSDNISVIVIEALE